MIGCKWEIRNRHKIPITLANATINASGFGYGPKVITGYGATATNLIIVSFLKSIYNSTKM